MFRSDLDDQRTAPKKESNSTFVNVCWEDRPVIVPPVHVLIIYHAYIYLIEVFMFFFNKYFRNGVLKMHDYKVHDRKEIMPVWWGYAKNVWMCDGEF